MAAADASVADLAQNAAFDEETGEMQPGAGARESGGASEGRKGPPEADGEEGSAAGG